MLDVIRAEIPIFRKWYELLGGNRVMGGVVAYPAHDEDLKTAEGAKS